MRVVISKSGVVTKPFLQHITLVQGDIVTQEVGAICTLIPQNMDFKGRLNHCIADACGYDLDAFIQDNIKKPRVGEVYALPGGDLPARHILLGIMPHYRTEFDMNESHLSGVVRSMMDLARCMLLTELAFPALASGADGFAQAKASRLIVQGISDRMQEGFEEVRIVCDTPEKLSVFEDKLKTLGWKG